MANFDKVIPPGQEGKIEMAVDGHKVHGNFSKSATVSSNDPKNPSLTITLTGTELAYVDIVPPNRVYLQGGYNETVEKSVMIRSNEKDLDFKILDVSSNIDDKITYRVEETQPGEYELKVWKNPKLPTMSTYGTLNIRTNSEKAPETALQVQVITKGSISVTPSLVNFGRVKFGDEGKTGEDIVKSVTIIKADGEFNIRDLSVNSDKFDAKLSELVQGKTYRVDITFTPPAKTEPEQREMGELTIYTTDPYEPSITVRLVARSM